ncbi:MAG: TIGR02117 family protein [Dongiaceae bacterium]
MMRRAFRILALILAGVPLLYIAIAFGNVLLTPHTALPTDGMPIFTCDNGVHADLVLPVAAAGIDWRATFDAEAFAGLVDGFDHIGIGWGSRDFYLNTPTWADVRLTTALKALMWDDTVLHVEYRPEPRPGENCGVWVVGTEDYQRIVWFVRSTLADKSLQGPAKVAVGYGPRDTFYAAAGQYTAIDTCNQWTGQALRAGGAPVAPWTPFSFLVLWNLPMISS